jgi:hypothetical protein
MDESLTKTDSVIEKMEAQSEILRKQAKSMDESVVFGLRAYVGVHSIEMDLAAKRIFIQIENIGKVPASEIKVDVEMDIRIALACTPVGYTASPWSKPDAINLLSIPLRYDYGHAKLFPGNLKIKLIVPLDRWLTDEELFLIQQGHARFIVRGNINFCDGFNMDKNTAFALRYSHRVDCWLPHPVLSPEEEEKADTDHTYYV